MASVELPPMTFDENGGLRIVLVPTSDDDNNSEAPYSDIDDYDGSMPNHQEHHDANIPTHPVPSMQYAFAESLHEVTNGGPIGKPKLRQLDAKGRRERLLEQPSEAEPFDAAWRYRPGQSQHEMYKLVAQITFGVYLLLNGMANDNSQVVNILQGHIDEVDEFLEVMLEDFAQASKDLSERIAHLQLPMANREAFEEMLEDRTFRVQILEGNEKIDHILARTNTTMKQWDDDIDSGLRSSSAFADWLVEQKDATWKSEQPDLEDIYEAMKGNVEGWLNAFDDLNNQAQDLNGLIIKLMTIIAEMEKTAGEVSRKTWVGGRSNYTFQRYTTNPSWQASIPPFSLPLQGTQQDDASPESSPSRMSNAMSKNSTPRATSVTSGGSASTLQASQRDEDPEDDSIFEFPLPGGTPLLPPPRSSGRLKQSPVAMSPNLRVEAPPSPPDTEKKSDSEDEEKKEALDDGPLFILQPRTYTPQPPEPLPSPMVKNNDLTSTDEIVVHIQATDDDEQRRQTYSRYSRQPDSQVDEYEEEQPFQQKRTSLRQRVSLKTKPPESIHIPPRAAPDMRRHRSSSHLTSPHTDKSHAQDSAYGSDGDSTHRQPVPRAVSHADLTASTRPPFLQSPRSDHQQYYHPVRASPHSPLQQRPHTAVPADRPSQYYGDHQRQPSRMGGSSMLSNVTMATNDERPTTASQAGGKKVKKKKSAFGWLKKAFTLDEEEKAAFEARKAMAQQHQYYEAHSPKFLDGRRLR